MHSEKAKAMHYTAAATNTLPWNGLVLMQACKAETQIKQHMLKIRRLTDLV
jgi:hypothetical protein